jgi:hypothetical protein
MEMGGQIHSLAAFKPVKESQCLLHSRPGGCWNRSGCCGEQKYPLPLPGIEPRILCCSVSNTSNHIWRLLFADYFVSSDFLSKTFNCHLQNSTHFSTTNSNESSLSLYNFSARTTQKTQPLYCLEGLFTDPLPTNGRPIVERVYFRWDVFTESMPSIGSICHNSFGSTFVQM